MAEAFKHLLNAELVSTMAQQLQRQARALGTAFDGGAFVADATRGLAALEMKERSMRIADALQRHLSPRFALAAALIEAALAPPFTHDRLSEMRSGDAGLAGWALWPVGEFVVRAGMHEPERALALLREITQRFSAEFAIRPFIAAHPELAFATLARWVNDPNLHVRRLVSEGSRPRLPWGMQLKALVNDPSPTLPLLRALQDDESEYVRRSVANHLNDIAKDHPQLIAEWLAKHLPGASAQRRALLKHASRTLVKRGDPKVLAAWGSRGRFRGEATLKIKPARVAVGGEVQLTLALTSRARTEQALLIDYAVHHVKADGTTAPKVFKGWELQLAAGAELVLTKRHSLKPVTTRTYYSGHHRVVIQLNGAAVAEAAFNLTGGRTR